MQVQPAARSPTSRMGFALVYPDRRGHNVMRVVRIPESLISLLYALKHILESAAALLGERGIMICDGI